LEASGFVKWGFEIVVTVTAWLKQSAPTKMDLKCCQNSLSAAVLADLNVAAPEAFGGR